MRCRRMRFETVSPTTQIDLTRMMYQVSRLYLRPKNIYCPNATILDSRSQKDYNGQRLIPK